MAVLHTIASSSDDGAQASDESSVTQNFIERMEFSTRRASLRRLQLRPRTPDCASFGRAAHPPRSHRHQPARRVSLMDLQCDLSGHPPPNTLLIECPWRPYLSLSLLFGARPSHCIERHSDSWRCARRSGRRNDAIENGKNVVAPRTSRIICPDNAFSRPPVSTSPATSWSLSTLLFPFLRRRPTSCNFLFEKNIFAIMILLLTSKLIQFLMIPSPE